MIKRIFSIVSVLVLVMSCSSSDEGGSEGVAPNEFDRQAMLTHWADAIIIPVFEQLQADLQELVAAEDEFTAAPDLAKLENLRAAWLQAYKTWQFAEMFNIGLAEEINYGFQMNIYPVSVADIENNIAAGVYDLSHVNNNDAVGFPALDYMLYGKGESDAAIVEAYIGEDAAANRKYLSDLTEQMLSLTSAVTEDWKSNFRDVFVSNTSNSATGSLNKLTNDYIYYFEKGLRANKIGIPAGIFSTTPLTDRVEAYYNGEVSKVLSEEALTAVKNFFNGRGFINGAAGPGFKTYLDYLNTIKNGENLSALINAQFDAASTQLNGLKNSFAKQITEDNTQMTKTYDELQKAVVLLKVDMVQALNVSIDYVDADGD